MDSRRTILVAEDNPEISHYWVDALTRTGWSVTAARDGREAIACLDAAEFTMVVCDLHLGPGPTALDVLKRYPHRWRDTPFIVITGLGTVATCRDAMRLGARDFIEKPVSTEMFLFILENVMREHQGAEALPTADVVMPDEDRDTGSARVRSALMYLDSVLFRSDTSVAKVAEAAGVSTEHLARLFKRSVGQTPLEVIHTLRIKQAEKMLPNPRVSMHDIALECGYKSQQQFANWFRWKNGMSPQEWRIGRMGKPADPRQG